MAKKCPPGIFCIENYTLLFFVLLILVILVFMYIKYNNNLKNNTLHNSSHHFATNNATTNTNNINHNDLFLKPNLAVSNNNDILLNPYAPPMRDNRIMTGNNFTEKVPINVPTQSVDTSYRQIGILTRVNGPETILPLMGRPLFSNRDKWNFYTMNDKNNMIKLPISFKNKSCTNDQGCDNVSNGDTVHVEGYNDIFRVTVYDNNVMRYIPYL